MQYPNKCNDKKVCFIFCTNNEQFAQECMLYLNLLQIPEGYEMEVLAIEGASSIAAGYNEGMQASNAKYKVYIHHDTFITEPRFIEKIVDIFKQDEDIGIVGMIGTEELSKDGVMWHGQRCGDFYRLEEMMKDSLKSFERLQEGIREVEVVDGLLIATQYDIPWREDIFKGWDFYDVSQCMEFRRAGYRIVVPTQNPAWTIHACGIPSLWHYEENRQLVLREYPEIRERK
ncbi:MAG: glycosyltransferase family protein [Lachnospiraceae bacterium]|nr:glycosyltransferase family protein [Lachnospiraceae bacterium]